MPPDNTVYAGVPAGCETTITESGKDGLPLVIVQTGFPDIYYRNGVVMVQDWVTDGIIDSTLYGQSLVFKIEVTA